MFRMTKNTLAMIIIVVFSFIYRSYLMLRAGFPPGADIGLHNSIINSITQAGGTNFLWNNYHMGGGVSLTFPGYHIFVSYIILITGLSEVLVHVLVSCLFSSLIVLVAFLITKKFWSSNAAWIVALLIAFSRLDIEMLAWGGYPNIVALTLIPLAFYFFLQNRFSSKSFLIVGSLLSASIFLTHSLSAVVFVGTILFTVLFGTVFSNRFTIRKTQILLWLLPLVFGAIIISPFLANVLPVLMNSTLYSVSGFDSNLRLFSLSTQPLTFGFILPLVLSVFLILLFSKYYKNRFFSLPALLTSLWILIPLIGTQGYQLGFYTDYTRFRYYVYLPVIMVLGLVINFIPQFIVKLPDYVIFKLRSPPQTLVRVGKILTRLRPIFSRKTIYSILILVFLFYSLFSFSFFAVPSEGERIHSFYQVMNGPSFEAIEWAKTNTPATSLFVAEGFYGWWFSGFSQRRTFSASEPQFLILSREFEPAQNARDLLDTDYVLDNGIIQIREDGGYISRHNPLFSAKVNGSFWPYDLFQIPSSNVTIVVGQGEQNLFYSLSELSVLDMSFVKSSDAASVIISRGNSLFNCTQSLTVYRGLKFANLSFTFDSMFSDLAIKQASLVFNSKYARRLNETNTLGLFDNQTNVLGQLIFTKSMPKLSFQALDNSVDNTNSTMLEYDFGGRSNSQLEIFAGVYVRDFPSVDISSPDQLANVTAEVLHNAEFYKIPTFDLPIYFFNYQQFLADSNVSYVVSRDFGIFDKFENDPQFSVVFNNSQVKIFKVNPKNLP